jgi:1-acyl-sn-glycerol-3-phosphate acyltransferase
MRATQTAQRRSTQHARANTTKRRPRRRRPEDRTSPVVGAERPTYDLAERDPQYISATLPLLRLYTQVYHRAEVRGIERVPADGPVLIVGNHSGGITPPDAPVFAVASIERFGIDRATFLLSHDIVFRTPLAAALRRWGMMPATRANTRLALDAGHGVMVFPGGDYDAFRPTSESARIDFGGRKGFIDLALETGAPIVPLAQIGGQETQLFLTRGEWLARFSPLQGAFRSKLMPFALGFPFGVTMGGVNWPLPAKITAQVLEPIDVRVRFGTRPDRDEVYAHLTGVMQAALDALASERRWPILG